MAETIGDIKLPAVDGTHTILFTEEESESGESEETRTVHVSYYIDGTGTQTADSEQQPLWTEYKQISKHTKAVKFVFDKEGPEDGKHNWILVGTGVYQAALIGPKNIVYLVQIGFVLPNQVLCHITKLHVLEPEEHLAV